MTAIERLFCCSPHGSAVMPALAQAWDQLKWGPQRWLEAGSTIQNLAPKGERLLLLSAGAELVDWAEAVAAWRLPTLLLIPAGERLRAEAALHYALLQQQQVPVLGLLQVGEPWHPADRQGDALPWLGCWNPDEPQELAAFGSLLQQRFLQLDPSQGA
ncbi:hypothetical protein [Synechococcus sp. MIT S9452]|uniref:hypothetical protein n=1 Tax=Synechococcus sp. MIT S9452 TaxID=3082546 RepID=UPI0039A68270